MQMVSPEAIKNGLRQQASQFHYIGAWVAIIFDPLFAITDYINIPESWFQVFILRLSVSAITLVALFMYKRQYISTYFMIAIPFLLISLQNAYTYSLIGNEHILGHNLNYLALFMGAGLFILWPLNYTLVAIGVSILASIYFMGQNPTISLKQFALDGGLLLGTGALFTILLIEARYRLRKSELVAKLALNISLETTERQKKEIELKNVQLVERSRQLKEANSVIESMNLQLQDHNAQLEKEVEHRTRKLQKSNTEMNRLVYSLSHDFRTPLVGLRGLIDLASAVNKVDEMRELIGHMNQSVNRFDELLNDMTNYSVYWKESIDIVTIDLKKIICTTWNYLEYSHKNEISLILSGNDDDWVVNCAAEKMRVICYCILSNSINFKNLNGPNEVKVSIEKNGKNFTLNFQDCGIGIKEEIMPRIFDMFFRGSFRSKGAGIGLYIAAGIAEQLGGTISVNSIEDAGTSTTVIIPLNTGLQQTKANISVASEAIKV